jgi:hypothetical protein
MKNTTTTSTPIAAAMMRLFRSVSATHTIVVAFVACGQATPHVTVASADHVAPPRDAGSLRVAPDDAADVVTRWNAAQNRHDAGALAALYATNVTFYGADLTNAECVERKRVALAAAPDYAQTLSDLELAGADQNDGVFVRFTKTTATQGRSKSFFGYVYVIGGHIVAEGDRNPEASEIATRYTYCYGAGQEPNDLRVGIFKVSSLEAVLTVRYSKAFAEEQAASSTALRPSIRDCAHGCAPGDFGTCKEGDVVPFFVVASIGNKDLAGFGLDPLTKKLTRIKLSAP